MKKYRLFLLFIIVFFSAHSVIAQEEVYEKPAVIIDTLYDDDTKPKDAGTKQQKADVLTKEEQTIN